MVAWPKVSILMLNWNGVEDTLDALRSLRKVNYPNFDVIVVDNGSTDNSVETLRTQFPDVVVLRSDKNLGFTGGNNKALRYVLPFKPDYVLLLNNDTIVHEDFLTYLVAATEADPSIGIAGPMLYFYADPKMIWSAGGLIDWRRGKTSMIGTHDSDDGQYGEEAREVDFVSGCALLIRSELVRKIGLLDERFFAYYEEVEWCVRASRHGKKIIHIPRSLVWHKIPLDARGDSPFVHYYMTRNRLLFLRLTNAGWRPWIHTLVFEYFRTLLAWTIKPKWRGKRAHRVAMRAGIRDAIAGSWGARQHLGF